MSRCVSLLLVSLWISSAAADGAPKTIRELRAVRLTGTIVVDGALDEPAWQTAPPCSIFTQSAPVEGAHPSQRTEVRVLYDKNALYVGARLYDTAPDSIVSELSRRDVGTRSDKFTVYLDPYHDRRTGYYFGVNAAGTQFDGTLYNDSWSDNSWDGVWDGRARRDAQGWTCEMRIPFSQLRFARADVQEWGINFLRELGRGFEDDYFVCRPRKASGFVSLFPTLTGLEQVNPSHAIEVVPFATSKAEFLRVPQDPFHTGEKTHPNLGGDLRMPIGSKLTLNATVNPDFGQVEVDPAVVNLSDVETFFPEKRPFFVEGSSIFGNAGQEGASDYWGFNWPQPTFFYSRRIGRAPEGALPADAIYSDVPAGTTILGAAKLTGKPSPSLDVGALSAVTGREIARNERSDLSRFDSEVEPLSYYGVGRVLKEFPGRRNGLGLLSTYAHRELGGSGLQDQFDRDAAVAIVDGWHFLDSKQVWVLSGWAGGSIVSGTAARITDVQTDSRHYFQRPDARSYSVDSSATSLRGGGARVWLNKEKGNWFSNSGLGILSPGFEVNDLGFQSRGDLINGHIGTGYRWTEPTKQVKNHNVLAAVYGSTNLDGDFVSGGIWSRAFWWFTNNWTFQPTLAYYPQTLDARRSRGGPLMLDRPGYQLGLFGDTDGSRKRYYYVSYSENVQPAENSYDYTINPYFSYKPRANLKFEIGPGYESARNGAFYVATVPDPTAVTTYGNRYVFARLDQQTFSANIRLSVSFTPRMSLQFYGQPLISCGRYSDFRELARPRSLDFVPGNGATWTYDPQTRTFDPDGAGPETGSIEDFNSRSLRGNAVFRWEYRPGAAFYFVWTQERDDTESIPDFDLGPSFSRLGKARADDIFLAKFTYYLGL